ncbi:porin family protein [Flavivirga spongiicola]|uniref:PorT family protein n=1 Tax=Flavivirga spongiicola TaxID=421621 RepID=A0ABU7XTD2_9FLAO|nr:porin family protein [Flavivirga sp. MEBiC05379]MDO5978689.1 porin family protein [Flavivirga sp. MEBiC05379]
MKRTLLIGLIASLPLFSFSQNKIGIFGGANYSYFTNGTIKNVSLENSMGIQLGMLYEIRLTDKIDFRPKLLFSQQGDKKTEQISCNCFEINQTDFELSYINIPLDFKFGNKVYLITGPQIGFLINEKKLSNNFIFTKTDIDIGFNVGFGTKFNDFFIEFGAYQGFTDLFNYPISQYKGSARNGLFKLSFGYYL